MKALGEHVLNRPNNNPGENVEHSVGQRASVSAVRTIYRAQTIIIIPHLGNAHEIDFGVFIRNKNIEIF